MIINRYNTQGFLLQHEKIEKKIVTIYMELSRGMKTKANYEGTRKKDRTQLLKHIFIHILKYKVKKHIIPFSNAHDFCMFSNNPQISNMTWSSIYVKDRIGFLKHTSNK